MASFTIWYFCSSYKGYILMQNTLNLSSIRAKKARLGHRIGRVGLVILGVSAFVLIGLFIYLLSKHENHIIYLLLAGGLLCSVIAIWYEEDLAVLTPQDSTLTGSVDHQVLALKAYGRLLNLAGRLVIYLFIYY
jgi:hypothetical protein